MSCRETEKPRIPPWGLARKAASRFSVQLGSRAIARNGGAASLARPPSTRWHRAHELRAMSLPETGSPNARTEPLAITMAQLNAIIAQTL